MSEPRGGLISVVISGRDVPNPIGLPAGRQGVNRKADQNYRKYKSATQRAMIVAQKPG